MMQRSAFRASGRVLAVLNSGIGNTVQAIPALRLLRTIVSPGNLTIAATPLNMQVVEPLALADAHLLLPPGRSILRFLLEKPWRLRQWKHAFLFYSCYSGRLEWLRRAGLIRHLWRIDAGNMRCSGPSGEVMQVSGETHEAELDLKLIAFSSLAIAPLIASDLDLAPGEKLTAQAELASRYGVEPGGVWVHPGWLNRTFYKALPPDWTCSLLRTLLDSGRTPVLLLGSEEEAWLKQRGIALPDGCRVVGAVAPLRRLAAAMASAGCLISSDSGMGHLASAAGVPVISCFGPTSPLRCRVNGLGPVRVVTAPGVGCLGCKERGEVCAAPNCMANISLPEVVELAVGFTSAR